MALKISDLLLSRGEFSLTVPALTVADGEIVSVVGPSGSGKSSLVLAVAGFIPLAAGEIYSGDSKRIDCLAPERREVGFLFQRSALFPHLSVRENVEFGLKVRGVSPKQRKERALDSLERVQIADLSGRRPAELSGGQAQRVALARVLVVNFPILLLDEPFACVDPPLRKDLRRLVAELVADYRISCMLVTHDLEDLYMSRRVAVIERGLVSFLGTTDLGRKTSTWLAEFMA